MNALLITDRQKKLKYTEQLSFFTFVSSSTQKKIGMKKILMVLNKSMGIVYCIFCKQIYSLS